MVSIRYSLVKLLLFALLTLGIAVFLLGVLLNPEGFMNRQGRGSGWLRLIAENDWLSISLFALSFGGAVLLLALAFGNRTALAFDAKGVEVHTPLARYRVAWAEVAGMGFEWNRRRGDTLFVALRRETSVKKVYVSVPLLAPDRAEIGRLLALAGQWRGTPAAVRPSPQPAAQGGFGRRRA